MDAKGAARVDCRECHFSAVVGAGDDGTPAGVVVAHGAESGHELPGTTIGE